MILLSGRPGLVIGLFDDSFKWDPESLGDSSLDNKVAVLIGQVAINSRIRGSYLGCQVIGRPAALV